MDEKERLGKRTHPTGVVVKKRRQQPRDMDKWRRH
jgi:hypothetical protein